ncbi:YtxH domain-containing protein [Bacillus tianshenii]|nr:YtxH domain-containing protein [Bacillus tianshenii]
MAKASSFIYGILTGALLGGTAVLFSTPKSGPEMRESIKTNSEKAKESLQAVKRDVVALTEQVKTASKESAETIKQVSGDLQVTIQQWKKDIQPHQKRIQKELQEIEEAFEQLEQIMNDMQNEETQPQS